MSDKNILSGRKSAARTAAVQALYIMDLTDLSADDAVEDFLNGHMPMEAGMEAMGNMDEELFSSIVHVTAAQKLDIDKLLMSTLDKDWPLERLDKILRALLRAGTAELLGGGVDAPIVINDYMNIAHSFFSGREPAFANAVLDKIAKDCKNFPK